MISPQLKTSHNMIDHPQNHDFNEGADADEDTLNDSGSDARQSSPLPRLDASSAYKQRKPSPVDSEITFEDRESPPRESKPFSIRGRKEIPIPVPDSPGPGASAGTDGRAGAVGRARDEEAPEYDARDEQAPQGGSAEEQPKIHIPKIPPIPSDISPPPDLAELAKGLEGMYVDEFGNILDWNGHVLGRVEGDLPSMIGRPISSTGEVFNEDGDVVGYVAENDTIAAPPSPKPLEGVAGNGLKVDHLGNILDGTGKVIGHFNAEPLAPRSAQRPAPGDVGEDSAVGAVPQTRGRGHQKSSATPSPSEIFLDVKSTNDGIQLIIKIPTVFNRDQPSGR